MKNENLMKLSLMLILACFLFSNSLNFVSPTTTVDLNDSSSNVVQFIQLKYDPYPVTPGDYFDIWIEVRTKEKSTDWTFELVPEYPFSLDVNEDAIRNYEDSDLSNIVMKYRVRVAEDALDGTYDLKIKYDYNNVDYYEVFEVTIEDSTTEFDAVIQDTSDSEVSIAIANVGKYTANSVVVRIPEQDSFEVSGSNGQMVGNLDSGDYTIISFEVSASMGNNQMQMGEGFNPENQTMPSEDQESDKLLFNIYYTDTLGVRRIVNMTLPLQMETNMSSMLSMGEMGDFSGRDSTSWWSNWYYLIILAILGGGIFIWIKKHPHKARKIGSKLKPKKKSKTNNEIPEWIKNSEKKNKK